MRKQVKKILGLVLLIGMATAASAADNTNARFAALHGNPGLHSASAIVLDSQGNKIYAKDVVTGEERRITDSTAVDAKPAVSGTMIASATA